MPTCAECGKTLATSGGLEIHMEMAHKADSPASDELQPLPVAAAPRAELVPLERPRRESKLTGVPVMALAIFALLVAGVATVFARGNEKATTPLAILRASANTTVGAGSARVSVTVKSDSGVLARGLTVDGGYDFDNHRATMEIDPSKFGLRGVGTIEALVDYSSGLVMYMKFPPSLAAQLGNKPWVKIDVGALLKQAGLDVDLGSLIQGQSNDPTHGLAMVRGAVNEVVVGTEDVRGTSTTHYRVTVDLDKAIADAPASGRDTLKKLSDLYTVRTFPVDVWLDGDGRVRRYQQTIDPGTIRLPAGLPSASNPFGGHVTTTYELYDFGASIDVHFPPPDQVTDLNDQIKQGR